MTIFTPHVIPLIYRFSITGDGVGVQERIQFSFESPKEQVLSSLRMGNDQAEVPILGRIGGIGEDREAWRFLSDLAHHLPRVYFVEVKIDQQEGGVEIPEHFSNKSRIARGDDYVSISHKFLSQEFSNFFEFAED